MAADDRPRVAESEHPRWRAISSWTRGRAFGLALACASPSLAWPSLSQIRAADEAGRAENVTLQYRTARDAYSPSEFVAVIDGGFSVPLKLTWDPPQPASDAERQAQEKGKKRFDDLIRKLEAEQINGVEFEGRGEWLERGYRLRLASVPQLTEAGKRRIGDRGR